VRQDGKFTSFMDFLSRVDLRKVNKRVIESLIKCGSFDTLGYHRRQLMECCEGAMEEAQRKQKELLSNQSSFFDELDNTGSSLEDSAVSYKIPDLPEWDRKELLSIEKETLGFYITGHPLHGFENKLKLVTNTDSNLITTKRDKDTITIAGVISTLTERLTRKKDVMCNIVLEDLQGSIGIIFWADVYKRHYELLHADEPVVITGTIDVGDESLKVIAHDVIPLSKALENPYKQVRFMINADKATPENIISLNEAIKKYSGKYEGYMHIINGKSETIVYLGDQSRLDISDKLKKEVDGILGEGTTTYC
jgi:DNA polymerase-3 subunit alpha